MKMFAFLSSLVSLLCLNFLSLLAQEAPKMENQRQEMPAQEVRQSFLPVTISAEGELFYFENSLASEAFQEYLKMILKADPEVIVRLEGSEQQEFEVLLEKIEFLRTLGFTRFQVIHSFQID